VSSATAFTQEIPDCTPSSVSSIPGGRRQDCASNLVMAYSFHLPSNSCLLCHSDVTDSTVNYTTNQYLFPLTLQTTAVAVQVSNEEKTHGYTVTKKWSFRSSKGLYSVDGSFDIPGKSSEKKKIFQIQLKHVCHFPLVDIY
jgi:hypothetical protein